MIQTQIHLGERIRIYRRRKKWSQMELAQRVGYSMNGIAKIERGESDPRVSALGKIAEALDIDVAYLLTGTGVEIN